MIQVNAFSSTLGAAPSVTPVVGVGFLVGAITVGGGGGNGMPTGILMSGGSRAVIVESLR